MAASIPPASRRAALLLPAGLLTAAAGPVQAVPPRSEPAGRGRPAGQAALPYLAALASHGILPGEPDLVLRWTAIPARARAIRVVVHLHGFCAPDQPLRLVQARLPGSGLTLPASPPTIALLPRGRPVPGRPGAFDWPAFATAEGFTALVREALGRLGPGLPPMTRLVVTAHSGGGAGLALVLQGSLQGGLRVDEAHLFDGLYGDPDPLLRWAIDRSALRRPGQLPPALVVLTRPGTPTEPPSRRLAIGLAQAGLTGPRWRVLMTMVPHGEIPRRFGPTLLADAGAPLPTTSPA